MFILQIALACDMNESHADMVRYGAKDTRLTHPTWLAAAQLSHILAGVGDIGKRPDIAQVLVHGITNRLRMPRRIALLFGFARYGHRSAARGRRPVGKLAQNVIVRDNRRPVGRFPASELFWLLNSFFNLARRT
jgi:hypothetical protein